jgi:hypothetical protein
MSQYRIGDRVRVVKSMTVQRAGKFVDILGETGTVVCTDILSWKNYVAGVQLDNERAIEGTSTGFRASEIAAVESAERGQR